METEYPVINTLPCGRRQVGVDGKGRPAIDEAHASGYVCHPDDLPVHNGWRPAMVKR